jgi:riboflavin biosynthesis pyrimidine reductase
MNTNPNQLLQLIPCDDVQATPIDHLYLHHGIRSLGAVDKPFVYSNFIISLDGRVSVADKTTRIQKVPEANTNINDITLFMQLLAQSDVVVTTGRHLRAVERHHENNMLSLHIEQDAGLIQWRLRQGLSAQPDLMVFSETLRLPDTRNLPFEQSPISVITWSKPDKRLEEDLIRKGYTVLVGPAAEFNRRDFLSFLQELKYKAVYSVAGPSIFSQLIRYNIVQRLYLTITQIMLGGDQVNTITSGLMFEQPKRFSLKELYFDNRSPDNAGQFFCVFDCT